MPILCRCGSMVEQGFRKAWVGGSIPLIGFIKLRNNHFVIARLDRAIQELTKFVDEMLLDSPNKSENDS